MNEQIRKSFSNSKSLFPSKKDLNKINHFGIINHKPEKLPTLTINSKNSEILGLSPVKKKNDSNLNEIILRQNNLTLSRTQIKSFNKNRTSNYNLRKKSTNIMGRNPNFNHLFSNTLNNLKNINPNSQKKRKNYKSVQIIPNSTINTNNNILVNLAPLPIK